MYKRQIHIVSGHHGVVTGSPVRQQELHRIILNAADQSVDEEEAHLSRDLRQVDVPDDLKGPRPVQDVYKRQRSTIKTERERLCYPNFRTAKTIRI